MERDVSRNHGSVLAKQGVHLFQWEVFRINPCACAERGQCPGGLSHSHAGTLHAKRGVRFSVTGKATARYDEESAARGEQRAAGKVRVPYRFTGWPDRALDWSRLDVQEHYMKFIREMLGSWDLDGIELDWMRFGYHFGIGRELEGGETLTQFIRDARRECQKAGRRLGRPLKLGVRVPSTPETARSLGMDGVAWARAGLIDLLVPTPFWATCEFDMPMPTWHRLLEGTQVTLAGGLEIRYQPSPGGPARMMTPELAAGAAMAVLAGGADLVYLFNYFASMHLGDQWTKEQYDRTLNAMSSLDELDKLPRRHAVTYRDVRAPGEPADASLPASGNILAFRLQTGPEPAGRDVSVLLELEGEQVAAPELRVNGTLCPAPQKQSDAVFVYPVPEKALADEAHVVEAAAPGGNPMKITRVEFAIGPKADQEVLP